MVMPKDAFQNNIHSQVVENWRTYLDNLERSLDMLESGLDEAAQMQDICTSEWCEATEHVIDDLSNSVFSISEPRWAPEADSIRLKQLKRKVHDLYAKYKASAS